jgi:hypothetical protein
VHGIKDAQDLRAPRSFLSFPFLRFGISDLELPSDFGFRASFGFRVSDFELGRGRRSDRSTRRGPYPELINDDEKLPENNKDLNHKGHEGHKEIGIREWDIPAFVVRCLSFVPFVFFVVLPVLAATGFRLDALLGGVQRGLSFFTRRTEFIPFPFPPVSHPNLFIIKGDPPPCVATQPKISE